MGTIEKATMNSLKDKLLSFEEAKEQAAQAEEELKKAEEKAKKSKKKK